MWIAHHYLEMGEFDKSVAMAEKMKQPVRWADYARVNEKRVAKLRRLTPDRRKWLGLLYTVPVIWVLNLVRNAGGSWTSGVVADTGYDADLADVGSGLPRGVYIRYLGGPALVYRAYHLEGGGSAWTASEIASIDGTGPVQIRVGPGGESQVIYADRNTIHHARIDCP
jgi:hypothetical protein